MQDEITQAAEVLDGKYNKKLSSGDFCVDVPNIGLVFSLSFTGNLLEGVTISSDFEIHGPNDEKPIFVHSEGRFISGTRSFTGTNIPNRIYLSIPPDLKISPDFLRASRIEIKSVQPAANASPFDNFRVSF